MVLNKEKVEKLYDLYGTGVKRLFEFYLRNTHDAEDLSQDLWLKVAAMETEGDIKKLMPPLFSTIAHNMSIDHMRKNKKYISAEQLLESELLVSTSELDPALGAENNEMRSEVLDIVNNLPPEYRDVVVLRYYNDLNLEAIAEFMKLSVSAIQGRLDMAHSLVQESWELHHNSMM